MKVFNRGVKINVPADQVALLINNLNFVGANNALYAGNTAKTAQNQIRGRLKLDVRPTGGTTEDYAYQIRSESGKTSGTHWGIDSETHQKANGTTSIRGVQGVAVVDTGYTVTNGTLIGVYGQARADGAIAGGGGFLAALYGLIEEGGGAVAASHVASLWLDSHRNTAVTGEHELLYMTNNGTATMDQAIFIYPGNKISHLITIDPTDTGLVADATGETLTPVKKINVKIDGQTYVIHAGTSTA
jgi:hypothetical protein